MRPYRLKKFTTIPATFRMVQLTHDMLWNKELWPNELQEFVTDDDEVFPRISLKPKENVVAGIANELTVHTEANRSTIYPVGEWIGLTEVGTITAFSDEHRGILKEHR